MNIMRISASSVVIILLSAPVVAVSAQSLSTSLAQLESQDYATRTDGFYRILALANQGAAPSRSLRPSAQRLARYAHDNPRVATALIALLEHENAPGAMKDAQSEEAYYGDLIGCVAELKDPRAVNALFAAIETGDMATQGLAALGEAALPRLLAAARSPDHRHQLSAVQTLSEMAAVRTEARVSPKGADQIRGDLLTVLQDRNRFLRLTALDGLASFSDASVRAALENVAKNDPFVMTRNGRTVYQVRERAAALLAKGLGSSSRGPVR